MTMVHLRVNREITSESNAVKRVVSGAEMIDNHVRPVARQQLVQRTA